MTPQIYGIRNMNVKTSVGEAAIINLELVGHPYMDGDVINQLRGLDWQMVMPGKVIIKCGHCGQFGAIRTACKHCGAPING